MQKNKEKKKKVIQTHIERTAHFVVYFPIKTVKSVLMCRVIEFIEVEMGDRAVSNGVRSLSYDNQFCCGNGDGGGVSRLDNEL